MGLFQRKDNTSSNMPLFTVSSGKTYLVVGLGNIGKEYDGTRHNLGFECIDAFAASQGFAAWQDKKDLHCKLTIQNIGNQQVILIKPTTYMNESGQAVQAVQHYYRVDNARTLVVHDELDLPFGQVRARLGGGSAGNNGLKSIIATCGEDFTRLRIGIANEYSKDTDSADFVLAKLSKQEKDNLPLLMREVSGMISEFVASGQLPHDTRKVV